MPCGGAGVPPSEMLGSAMALASLIVVRSLSERKTEKQIPAPSEQPEEAQNGAKHVEQSGLLGRRTVLLADRCCFTAAC
jgi:hypothetical protein